MFTNSSAVGCTFPVTSVTRETRNEAISTANLKQALASLGVAKQFFFVDACRNGHPELRKRVIKGSEILNEDPSDEVN